MKYNKSTQKEVDLLMARKHYFILWFYKLIDLLHLYLQFTK